MGMLINLIMEINGFTACMHMCVCVCMTWAFLVAQMVKNPPAVSETWI